VLRAATEEDATNGVRVKRAAVSAPVIVTTTGRAVAATTMTGLAAVRAARARRRARDFGRIVFQRPRRMDRSDLRRDVQRQE
jgi:hypothetical protein